VSGLRLFGSSFPLVAGNLPPHIPYLRALLTGRVLATIPLLLAWAGVQAAVGAQGHLPVDTTPVQGAEEAIAQAKTAGIDFGAVIERVRHHIAPAPGKGSVLAVESRLYRAEFGPGGFTLTLRGSLSEQELAVRTAAWRTTHPLISSDVAAYPVEVAPPLPASVLAQADYPLTLDPVISPEYPVSEPVYQSLPAGSRYQPAVAFNREAGFDASFLVVWSDTRFGDYDVFAARVNPDGVLLDPVGIAVSTAVDEQQVPRVASQGYSFLIVWNDRRSETDWDVYGARVSSNGFLRQAKRVQSLRSMSDFNDSMHEAGVDCLFVRHPGGGYGLELDGLAIMDIPECSEERATWCAYYFLQGRES